MFMGGGGEGEIRNIFSDPSLTQKILKSLSITLPAHILRSRDPRAILTSLFGAWLPLSTAMLVSVVEYLPSPPAAQAIRMPSIIDASPGADHVDPKLRAAVVEFKSGRGQPVLAYVSKMMAVPESQLPEKRRNAGGRGLTAEEARELGRRKRGEIARAKALTNEQADAEQMTSALSTIAIGEKDSNRLDHGPQEAAIDDPEHLIGFARLYSGTLSVGDEIYVIPPKFSPARAHSPPQPSKTTITGLYLMMGRSLEALNTVPAGVVFGVAGLDGHILKSGTLCSMISGGVNLAGLSLGSQPIVRVALEPVNPSDLDSMIKGLKLLVQSDPSAEYEVLENGEHVVTTAGELHLERCLKDLRERFARCEIQAGEPIVPYRETIVHAAEMAPPKEKSRPRGTVLGITASKQLMIRLRVRPLPEEVTEFLDKHVNAIRSLNSQRTVNGDVNSQQTVNDGSQPEHQEEIHVGPSSDGLPSSSPLLQEFRQGLKEAFQAAKADGEIWADVVENVIAFGPKRIGPNLLIDVRSSAGKDGDSHSKRM